MESSSMFHEQNPESCGKSTTHAPGEGSNMSLAIGKKFRTFQSINHVIKTFCDENFHPFKIERSMIFDSGSKYYQYKSIIFSCVHSGVCREKREGIQPRQSILRTGCPAVIKVRLYDNPCLHYQINYLNLNHNHEISPEQYRLHLKEPCLSKEDKAFLFEIMASNATNKDIKLFIQDVMNKKPTAKDVLNLRARYNKIESSTIKNWEQITYCKATFAEKWNALQKQKNDPKFLKIYKQLDDLYFGSSNAKCISQQSKSANISKKVTDCDKLSDDAPAENADLPPLRASTVPKKRRKHHLPVMNTSQKYLYAKIYADKLATLLSQCNNQELETKLKFLSLLIEAWECKEQVIFCKNNNGVLEIYTRNQNSPLEDKISNSEEDNISNSEEDNISSSEDDNISNMEEDNISNSGKDNVSNTGEDNISDSEQNAEVDVAFNPEENANIDLTFNPEQNNNIDVASSPEQSELPTHETVLLQNVPPVENTKTLLTDESLNVSRSSAGVTKFDENSPCKEFQISSPEEASCEFETSIPHEILPHVQSDDSSASMVQSDDMDILPNQTQNYESGQKIVISSENILFPEAMKADHISPMVLTPFKSTFKNTKPLYRIRRLYKVIVPKPEDTTKLTLSKKEKKTRNRARRSKTNVALLNNPRKILPKLVPVTLDATEVSSSIQEQNNASTGETITLPQSVEPSQALDQSEECIAISHNSVTEDATKLRTNTPSKRKRKSRKRARRPSKLIKLVLSNNLRKILPKLVPTTHGSTEVSSSNQEQNNVSTVGGIEPSQDKDQSEECIDIFHNSCTYIVRPTRSSPSKELQTSEKQAPSNVKESETSSLPVNENILSELVTPTEAETVADSPNQILDNPLTVQNDTLFDPVLLTERLTELQKTTKSKKNKHKNILDSSNAGERIKRVYRKRLKPSAKGKSKKPFTLPDLSRNILHISLFKDKIVELRTITMHKKLENLTNNLSDNDIEDILSENKLNDKIMNIGQILMHLKFPEASGLQDVTLGSALKFKVVTSKFVQIIYCKESLHWITISTLTSPPDTVYVYDSLDETVPIDAIPQICNIMNVQSPTLTIISQPMQVASNNADCGLFALASAITLLNEKDPSEIIYNANAFRQHLMSSVVQKDLQEFPTLSNGNVTKSAKRTETFDLYCICRQPLLTSIIEAIEQLYRCQICKNVFHMHCKPECCNATPSPSFPFSI